MFKALIILFLIAILTSLGTALYYLIHPKKRSTKLVKALTVRISLSLFLFLLIMIAYGLGWIAPHQL